MTRLHGLERDAKLLLDELSNHLRNLQALGGFFYHRNGVVAWVTNLHCIKFERLHIQRCEIGVYAGAEFFQVFEIMGSGEVSAVKDKERLESLFHKLLAVKAYSCGHNLLWWQRHLVPRHP